jgi:nitrate/nitrite-specific signal transduction histidine kinase
MHTNNQIKSEEQEEIISISESEQDVGRYSESPREDNSADLAESIANISQKLDQLYEDINQHVDKQLSQIDEANKNISQLIGNLNIQLKDSLKK